MEEFSLPANKDLYDWMELNKMEEERRYNFLKDMDKKVLDPRRKQEKYIKEQQVIYAQIDKQLLEREKFLNDFESHMKRDIQREEYLHTDIYSYKI